MPVAGTEGGNEIVLHDLLESVLLHELSHAVHGSWILSDSVWEEGMARASEMRMMGLLAAQGIVEPGYALNHSDPYDMYYENSNRSLISVQDGSIWGLGDPALPNLRYEQAGYVFGKLIIENPSLVKSFNSRLFQQPSGNLTQSGLRNLLVSVQPFVEGTATDRWVYRQQILSAAPAPGCALLQCPSQFTVDLFCRDATGVETPQAGATVRMDVYDAANCVVLSGQDVTTELGWVAFTPPTTGSYRRLRVVASVVSGPTAPSSTYYVSDVPPDQSALGVFGVVTNVTTGTVSFTSPDGQFAGFSVPVSAGGFSAPSLRSVRGPVEATFSGGGLTATRRFDKDASGYSVVMTAATAKCGYPGAATHAVAASGALTAGSAPTVPLLTSWTAASGTGCAYELQRQTTSGSWTTLSIGTSRSYAWRAPVGTVDAFRVRAVDDAGSPSTWALTIMDTLAGLQESSATYAGSFTTRSSSADWGGSVRSTSSAGASVTLAFTGRSIALVGRRASSEGSMKLYLDGVLISSPTEYTSGATTYRQVIGTWSGPVGSHTLKVVNAATPGHPEIDVDGFAVVRQPARPVGLRVSLNPSRPGP